MGTSLFKAIFKEKRLPWRFFRNKRINKLFISNLLMRLFFKVRISYRKNTVDEYIICENFWMKIYTPKKYQIKKTDTIFDIGSQIGTFSIYAAKKAKKGKIYCFEPVKDNFKYILKNIKLNNLKNIKPYNKGVSNKNEKIKLYHSESNTGGHSAYSKNNIKSKNYEIMECISLKRVIDENKIEKVDFLKMDCEGGEYNILFKTPKKYIDKIQKIAMEYHDLNEKRNHKEIVNFLLKNNFRVKISGKGNIGMIFARR